LGSGEDDGGDGDGNDNGGGGSGNDDGDDDATVDIVQERGPEKSAFLFLFPNPGALRNGLQSVADVALNMPSRAASTPVPWRESRQRARDAASALRSIADSVPTQWAAITVDSRPDIFFFFFTRGSGDTERQNSGWGFLWPRHATAAAAGRRRD
jgi:hypothetical protein